MRYIRCQLVMKFIENYRGGPYGAISMSPDIRDEFINRLQSNEHEINLEDLFHEDSYKIEHIHISDDWSDFENKAAETSSNVIWTTRIMRIVVLAVIFFALIGVYSAFKYVT